MLAITTRGRFNVIDNNTIEGYELYDNKVKVYFYIKSERSFSSDSLFKEGDFVNTGTGVLEGEQLTLALTFNIPEKQKTGIKMGISFVDGQQAQKNLMSEIPAWDFESLKLQGQAKME